ncbi:hypothetical protein M9458_051694, partial [Cirrhinus mrigala]
DTDVGSTQEVIQRNHGNLFVIRFEGADIEDSTADVGVLEDKVLQDLSSKPYEKTCCWD